MKQWLHLTPVVAVAACAVAFCAPQPAMAASDPTPAAAAGTQQPILRQPVAPDVVELAHSPRRGAVFVAAPDRKSVV